MGKLKEAKILGIIGAVLSLIGGFLGGFGAIIGLILLFIAVKYIADETKDKSIFDNYLMSFIFGIMAIVAVVVIFFISIGGFSLNFFNSIQTAQITDFSSFMNFFGQYIIWWIVGLLIGWIFIIISALYLRKSYDAIAKHTNVNMFSTAGLINFIGAITLIIGIGILIIIVARILEIVAYVGLPDELPKAK